MSETMPLHIEQTEGKYRTCSHNSTYQRHTSRESNKEDREFSFWNSSNTLSYYNDCDHQLGESYKRKDFKFGEHSPFLHGTHHRSSSSSSSSRVSDPSRSKAIEEGRKELMEMVEAMPESSFELSFQDMVDEKQIDQDETCVDKTVIQSSISHNSKAVISKPKQKQKSKRNNNRPRQIMRVESMDTGSFLLKMFFPTSLKKVRAEDASSKVSRRPSFQESAKQEDEDWREKSYPQMGDNRGLAEEDRMSKNTRSSSDKSRYFDRNVSFSQGCWPFLHNTKTIKKEVGK